MEYLEFLKFIDSPAKLVGFIVVILAIFVIAPIIKILFDRKNHKESMDKMDNISKNNVSENLIKELKDEIKILRDENKVMTEKLNLLLKKSELEDTINIFPNKIETFINNFIDENKSVDNGLLYIFNNYADNMKLLYRNMTSIDVSELNYNTFNSRLKIVKQKMHILFQKYIQDKNIVVKSKNIKVQMQNQEDILKQKILTIFNSQKNGELLKNFGKSLFEFVEYSICLINQNVK